MAEEIKKEGEDMIQIPKSQMDFILKRLEILTNSVDKSRLEWAMGNDPENKKPLVRRCNLNVYKNLEKNTEHIILGWRMVIDESYVTTMGQVVEKQIIKLFLDDGEGKVASEKGIDMAYVDFIRRTKKIPADILGINNDEVTKATMFKLKIVGEEYNGRVLEIDKTFVN